MNGESKPRAKQKAKPGSQPQSEKAQNVNNILKASVVEPILQPEAFIIVQARRGSTRLRDKVLLPLGKTNLLGFLLEKLKTVRNAGGVILATTRESEDDALVAIAESLNIPTIRGAVDDVLSRYVSAIEAFDVKTVIRLTADCPLHDPKLIESALDLFKHLNTDYLSNTQVRTYPRGFDIEICKAELLQKLNSQKCTAAEREHVTLAVPKSQNFSQEGRDDSDWRLTVDELPDYLLVNRIVEEFEGRRYDLKELQALLDRHPEWRAINQHVRQK